MILYIKYDFKKKFSKYAAAYGIYNPHSPKEINKKLFISICLKLVKANKFN